MKKINLIIFLLACLMLLTGAAPKGELRHFIADRVESPELRGASIGILAVRADGDTLACLNPEKLLLPASNLKLLTTALALHSLGEDYKWETKIAYDGLICDSTLVGNLYIVGGGDPCLGSDNPIACPIDSTFKEWAQLISNAGIRKIDGYIIGDGRFFAGMPEEQSWQYDDVGTYYGSGVSGLSFFENRQNFRVEAGAEVGAPLNIKPVYPLADWMNFEYECSTGAAESGNTLYFYPSSHSFEGTMRGTFAIDRKPKTEEAANKFPEYTCATYFEEYLTSLGIGCTLGATDNQIFEEEGLGILCPADSLVLLGGSLSPTLSDVVRETNYDSNNLYAETLMRSLGKEYCGSGCYDSAYVAVKGLLEEIQAGSGEFSLKDGSGLSRQNYVSAGFMCGFLRAMMEQPCFGEYIDSIPYPGSESTLKWFMSSCPEDTKARIRLKSGSMSGVRCYSGYIIPESGSKEDCIILSIMINNAVCKSSVLHRFCEDFIGLLANSN